MQNAECSGRTVGFFFAEGLGLPTGFLPCFLASALAALVRAFAIEVVEVFSFRAFLRPILSLPSAYPLSPIKRTRTYEPPPSLLLSPPSP